VGGETRRGGRASRGPGDARRRGGEREREGEGGGGRGATVIGEKCSQKILKSLF